jgi:hypothetical protein
MGNAPEPGLYGTVLVQRAGKSWRMWTHRLQGDAEVRQFEAGWKEFSRQQLTMTDDERDQVVAHSPALQQVEQIRREPQRQGHSRGKLGPWRP